MISSIRKHWGKLAFSLASFFWAGCTSEAQPLYGVSIEDSSSSTAQTSSSMNGDCPECTYGVAVEYSSSSAESSSSAIPMSSIPAYGVPSIDCYTTSVKGSDNRSYDIFECDNGNRYLKDYRVYADNVQELLPSDIIWSKPNRSRGEGQNCNFNAAPLCVDKWTPEGGILPGSGCEPSVQCPYKKQE